MKNIKILKSLKKITSYFTEEGGFSLLELLIALAIMAIIATLAVPNILKRLDEAKVQTTKTQIKTVENLLSQYYLDNGTYPSSDQGIKALIEKPLSEPVPENYNPGGYIQGNKIPVDGWGNEFLYNSPGTEGRDYEIISLGADKQEGGEGINADIKSWDI